MSEQKALFLESPVNGEWKVRSRGVQKPGPGEVLVKIHATALNPVDWKIQKLGYFASDFPFISGTDAAGVVEEIGAEVTTLAKGDKM